MLCCCSSVRTVNTELLSTVVVDVVWEEVFVEIGDNSRPEVCNVDVNGGIRNAVGSDNKSVSFTQPWLFVFRWRGGRND